MRSSENPKEYRVVGGSHDGELFRHQPADQTVKGKAELAHGSMPHATKVELAQLSMPHRTDATLREVYEVTTDQDGVSILRHTLTHAADMRFSSSLTMTRSTKADRERE